MADGRCSETGAANFPEDRRPITHHPGWCAVRSRVGGEPAGPRAGAEGGRNGPRRAPSASSSTVLRAPRRILREDPAIDYISSRHALQQIKVLDQVRAPRELRRVLSPGGVPRPVLPDLDRAIDAYRGGRGEDFCAHDWDTIDGNFITHIVWYSDTPTLFTYPFAHEVLRKAGFGDVRRVGYRVTASHYPEIVELDRRERERFYVEAFKEPESPVDATGSIGARITGRRGRSGSRAGNRGRTSRRAPGGAPHHPRSPGS
jgi:hypothetical protein